jgi:DNA gyrase inhibitor GyrI
MSELEVRIVQLEPMHVAFALGFSESPEGEAWEKILTWAKSKGLLDDLDKVRFFGFNNPDPSPGSSNYGYEQWITVDPGTKAEGDIKTKGFSGGLYAVARCKGVENIYPTWKQLVGWREDSQYKQAHHQWVEEAITPPGTPVEEMVLDLFLPIVE